MTTKMLLLVAASIAAVLPVNAVPKALLNDGGGAYAAAEQNPFLMYNFEQSECMLGSFTDALDSGTVGSGLKTLVSPDNNIANIACPVGPGVFDGRSPFRNGVRVTGSAPFPAPSNSGPSVNGVHSTGDISGTNFLGHVCSTSSCLGTGTVADGVMSFGFEFWFHYDETTSFPDDTKHYIFAEISDGTTEYLQIAYFFTAGTQQFRFKWRNAAGGIVTIPSPATFTAGLNHLVIWVYQNGDSITFRRALNNAPSSVSASADGIVRFPAGAGGAKLRIGDGIADDAIGTPIHQVSVFGNRPMDKATFETFVPLVYARGQPNSLPITVQDIFLTLPEDDSAASISSVFSDTAVINADTEDSSGVVFRLLTLPTAQGQLVESGVLAIGGIVEQSTTFNSNTDPHFYTIPTGGTCNAVNAHSSFRVRATERIDGTLYSFGSANDDDNVALVHVCIENVEDAPVPVNSAASVRYGKKTQVTITFTDPDKTDSSGTYEVFLKSFAQPGSIVGEGTGTKLFVMGASECTATEITLPSTGLLAERDAVNGGGSFKFCVLYDALDDNLSDPIVENARVVWEVREGGAAAGSDGQFDVEFTNPLGVCDTPSDCIYGGVGNEILENTFSEEDSLNVNTEGSIFTIKMIDSSQQTGAQDGYEFVLAELPKHGKLYIDNPRSEITLESPAVPLRAAFTNFVGTSVDLVYIPNEDYFNQYKYPSQSSPTYQSLVPGVGFNGCTDVANGCPDVTKFSVRSTDVSKQRASPVRDLSFWVSGVDTRITDKHIVTFDNRTVVVNEEYPLVQDGTQLIRLVDPDQDTLFRKLKFGYPIGTLILQNDGEVYSDDELGFDASTNNCKDSGCKNNFVATEIPSKLNFIISKMQYRVSSNQNSVVTVSLLEKSEDYKVSKSVRFNVPNASDSAELSDIVLAVIISAAAIVGCVFLSAIGLVLSKARQGGIAAKHMIDHQLGHDLHDSDLDSDDEEMAVKKHKKKKRARPAHNRNSKAIGKYTGDEELEVKDDSIFDWEKHIDRKTGDVYFFNPKTGESRWDPPTVKASAVSVRK